MYFSVLNSKIELNKKYKVAGSESSTQLYRLGPDSFAITPSNAEIE